MHAELSMARRSLVPAVGRILLAAIFLFSGIGKVLAPEATMGYIAANGLPFASFVLALAIAIEVAAGTMLALGFRARLAALVLTLFALATALAFHLAPGDPGQLIHLLKNLAIAGGLLQVATFGAGACSLDAAVRRRRPAQVA